MKTLYQWGEFCMRNNMSWVELRVAALKLGAATLVLLGMAFNAWGQNVKWSSLQNPTANLSLTHGSNTTLFTFGSSTGTANLFTIKDGTNNTGTGYLFTLQTDSGSTANPFRVCAKGTSDCVDLTAAGMFRAGRVNDLRWVGASPLATFDAGISDCASAPCVVVARPSMGTGSPTRSTWAETSALLDLRGDELDPFVLGRYFSPFKVVQRKTADSVGTLDVFATIRALQFHDSGGDNAGGGPKDTYFTFAGDLYSAGRGQDISVRAATFKFGEGDAAGLGATAQNWGNCLEAGGECTVSITARTLQGTSVMTAAVSTYTAGSRTIAYSSGVEADKLGVGRSIINTTAAKVYTTGSVSSVGSVAPPVVTGSGTGWTTQFGSGAHTDLCFSQNDDDAGGFKFVVPIRSIASDTSLTLDYDPQALDKTWPGDSNGSSYRIYKCAQIESHTFANAGDTTGSMVHATGGTTDWAATDTLEVPLGWAWYGSGASLIVQNNLPSISINGLVITNTGSDEPLTKAISVGGKSALGLVFDNTWECQANNVNCNYAGFTTGIRFQNPPTVGLQYATTVSGINEPIRLNDQFSAFTGNVRVFYSTTADGWNFEHAASTGNVIQLFPVNGSIIASIYAARSYYDIGGVTGTAPTAGLMRVRSGNGGTPLLVGRNQANSANVTLLTYSTADRFQLTQSGTPVEFVGGVHSDGGGFKHRRVSTGSIAASSSAVVTVSWTTTFADANYTANCSVVEATAGTSSLRIHHLETVAAGSVVVRVVNDDGAAAKTGTLHCAAVHD